jgi:hypothetical protein
MVTVRSLLKPGVDASVVNAFGYDGSAALHWVVLVDDIDTAKLLLAAGADAKLANRLGVTPLAIASTNGNEEMIRLLVKSGAIQCPGFRWRAAAVGSVRWVTQCGESTGRQCIMVFKDAAQQTTLMLAVPGITRTSWVSRGQGRRRCAKRDRADSRWVLRIRFSFGHGVGIVRGGLPERVRVI